MDLPLLTLLTLHLQLLLLGYTGIVLGLQYGNAIFNLPQAFFSFLKDLLGGMQVLFCLLQHLLGRYTNDQ